MLYVNKHVINPVMRTFAGYSRTPFVLVRHVGRRSGKIYETPIIAMRIPDGFMVALTYGPKVDWYRNVAAAGRCVLIWHSQEYAIEKIEPVDVQTGLLAFPQPFRFILGLRGNQDFVHMTSAVSPG